MIDWSMRWAQMSNPGIPSVGDIHKALRMMRGGDLQPWEVARKLHYRTEQIHFLVEVVEALADTKEGDRPWTALAPSDLADEAVAVQTIPDMQKLLRRRDWIMGERRRKAAPVVVPTREKEKARRLAALRKARAAYLRSKAEQASLAARIRRACEHNDRVRDQPMTWRDDTDRSKWKVVWSGGEGLSPAGPRMRAEDPL